MFGHKPQLSSAVAFEFVDVPQLFLFPWTLDAIGEYHFVAIGPHVDGSKRGDSPLNLRQRRFELLFGFRDLRSISGLFRLIEFVDRVANLILK